MNIDKKTLDGLASLDDKSLSSAIRMIATAYGVEIDAASLDASRLAMLRNAMHSATDADIANAMQILEEHKKK